jgi:THO complex subunit 5
MTRIQIIATLIEKGGSKVCLLPPTMAPFESRIPDAEPVINALISLVEPNYPFSLDSEEGQAYANAMFAKLKSLNRQAHATVRQYKQETSDVRASMDESLLKLQNLLYEKRHLEMEIEKCRQYG